MKDKAINLELSWLDAKLTGNGRVLVKLRGTTPGGKGVRVNLKMDVSSIGFVGIELHKAMKAAEEMVATAKQQLRDGQ